ncbi:RdgB/HAM1 family non-canonical purine NTP pyrophosphatase [Salinisphaera sp. RV14]|uniref:RdgB/HAM1 family non-canonical purine NTP pyrophosphatase n=1 Tax=unclassified Salinisphaera TaxID=2649847 RepID=UPI003F8506CD
MTERWVLASANPGKLSELAALLAELDIEVVSQAAFDVPDAVEDGVAFVDNALIKARHAAAATGLPAIADDSGLAVDYLGGAPGIRSARFAGIHGDDAANNAALLEALAGVPDAGRGAAFHCCLVATRAADDPVPVIAQGVWRGKILSAPRGDGGFGYDPLFWATEENASAAELTADRKNAVSHRGRAMAALIDRFRERR